MSTRLRGILFFVALILIALTTLSLAPPDGQEAPFDQYAKQEIKIPMRDGVRLFTAAYTPRDTSRTYPFLLMRTPYSVAPYGPNEGKKPLGPHEGFTRDGFIFVYQDVRGRMTEDRELLRGEDRSPFLQALPEG